MPGDVDSKAIYLYCFASFALLPAFEGVGVDGTNPVFLLPCMDVVALEKHYDGIKRFLHLVSGKDEWAVKAFLNRARPAGNS
ncbi:MAG: hypothetical protein ABSF52_07705 [Syntrophobacteraceae bacterium]|jgi:hypothetical protein